MSVKNCHLFGKWCQKSLRDIFFCRTLWVVTPNYSFLYGDLEATALVSYSTLIVDIRATLLPLLCANKAVIDRRLRPRCCHLQSYFKRPKSSPVRPLVCNWYYCAQFIAKPKAACALRFSWAATSSNLGS